MGPKVTPLSKYTHFLCKNNSASHKKAGGSRHKSDPRIQSQVRPNLKPLIIEEETFSPSRACRSRRRISLVLVIHFVQNKARKHLNLFVLPISTLHIGPGCTVKKTEGAEICLSPDDLPFDLPLLTSQKAPPLLQLESFYQDR